MVPPLLVQRPARCIFLKGCQRQDTCVYRRIFEHGWFSWIRLCSRCREWQCCVLGGHTHTPIHIHIKNADSSDLKSFSSPVDMSERKASL